MKKTILIIYIITVSINLFSQVSNDVNLTTIGTGQTKEEAKNNALRSAIEQAFGTFVSSNTSVVNDELIKDEIINVSNGNIKSYSILSEKMHDNNSWIVSLNAMVSPSNLTKFAESKGVKAEFKGALFAANVKIMELNRKNETIAIDNLLKIIKEIVPKCYDFSLAVSEPTSSSGNWKTEITVNGKFNDNIKNIADLINSTLFGLSIPPQQILNYNSLNITTHKCYLILNEEIKKENSNTSTKGKREKNKIQEVSETKKTNDLIIKEINLRDNKSLYSIMYILNGLLKTHSLYFKISNGIDTAYGYDLQCEGKEWTNKTGQTEYFKSRATGPDYGRKYPSGLYYGSIETNYSPRVISKYFKSNLYSFPQSQDICYKNLEPEKNDFISGAMARTYKCNDQSRINGELNDLLNQAANLSSDNEWSSFGNIFNLYSLQKNEVYFKISLFNILSTEHISKISEYKVDPVVNKNWFD